MKLGRGGEKRHERGLREMEMSRSQKARKDRRANGEGDGFSCGSPCWQSLLLFWHMMLSLDMDAAKASVCVCVAHTSVTSAQKALTFLLSPL